MSQPARWQPHSHPPVNSDQYDTSPPTEQQPSQKLTHESTSILKPLWKLIPFEWSREQLALCWICSSPSPAETPRYGSCISLPSFQTAHLPCQLGLQEPGTAFHLTVVHICNPVQQSDNILGCTCWYVHKLIFCTNDLIHAPVIFKHFLYIFWGI